MSRRSRSRCATLVRSWYQLMSAFMAPTSWTFFSYSRSLCRDSLTGRIKNGSFSLYFGLRGLNSFLTIHGTGESAGVDASSLSLR